MKPFEFCAKYANVPLDYRKLPIKHKDFIIGQMNEEGDIAVTMDELYFAIKKNQELIVDANIQIKALLEVAVRGFEYLDTLKKESKTMFAWTISSRKSTRK